MIDTFIDAPDTIKRPEPSPSGPCLEVFAACLAGDGFSQISKANYMRVASYLCRWLIAHGHDLATLDEAALATVHEDLRRGPRMRGGSCRVAGFPPAAHRFLVWLRAEGWVTTVAPPSPPLPPLVAGFEAWIQQHRGLAPRTLRVYRSLLLVFLAAVGDDPKTYTAATLRTYVLDLSQRAGRSFTKLGATVARMFLRYLATDGLVSPALIDAVPKMAYWKRASLPHRLDPADVQRLIDACNPRTAQGRRDRAMLLLLARLGLRSADVANLRLTDLAWPDGRIWVCGKGRRREALPLPQDVGDAILAYLLDGRPKTDDDHVFLTTTAPTRALHPSSVGAIVTRLAARAGIALPRVGSHVLRHTLASTLLNEGLSLPSVSALLRHIQLDTTLIYAKVDPALLQTVAQPWPLPVAP